MRAVEIKVYILFLTRQYKNEMVHDYMKRFKKNLKALKLAGGDRLLCAENVMKVNWSDLYDGATEKNDR